MLGSGMEARPSRGRDAMTREQTMLAALTLALLGLVCGGCNSNRRDRLDTPRVIVSPYDTTNGDVLWAVVPPNNESGVSIVREDRIGDAIVGAVQGVRGVRCLPINRTLAMMESMGIRHVTTETEAISLANALGVDGIVVGSVTAYDPYDPPTLGLAMALYARAGALSHRTNVDLDPHALSMAFTDFGRFDGARFNGTPFSVVSEHLDARDHGVLLELRRYAEGRSDRTSALGWRVYTASMELYTKFVAHHTVGRLIDEEWLRLTRER